MPEVSESSKGVFSRIKNLFGGKQEKDSIGKSSSTTEIISGIHKLLVEKEAARLQDYKKGLKEDKAEERQLQKRHKEILKALTVKRPKEKIEKPPKEVKPEAKPEAKPEVKPEVKRPVEAKPPAKVPEKPPAKAPEAKPPPKAEPAKPPAKPPEAKPPAKPPEVKPAEVKPPPKAEPVKPPEVKPPPKAEPVKPAEVTKPSAEVAKTAGKAAIATAAAVSATGVFANRKDFDNTMYPYAQQASQKLGGKVPPEAILGQWAGESGSGKNLSAPFNYAGIKAGKNDKKGDYVLTEEKYTDEQIKRAQASGESLERVLGPNDKITKKGKQVTIDEWYGKGSLLKAESEGKKWVQVRSYFAKFDDFQDFTNRYVNFLSAPRYKKALEQTSPKDFGYEVAKAGYATQSAEKYSEHIASYNPQLDFGGSGTALAQMSTENKDMKVAMTDQNTMAKSVNNITVASAQKEQSTRGNRVDDRSPYDRAKG